jgi:hypothetical protein
MRPEELAHQLSLDSDGAVTMEDERFWYIKDPDDKPIRIDITDIVTAHAHRSIELEATWAELMGLLDEECDSCGGEGIHEVFDCGSGRCQCDGFSGGCTHEEECCECDGAGKVNNHV